MSKDLFKENKNLEEVISNHLIYIGSCINTCMLSIFNTKSASIFNTKSEGNDKDQLEIEEIYRIMHKIYLDCLINIKELLGDPFKEISQEVIKQNKMWKDDIRFLIKTTETK